MNYTDQGGEIVGPLTAQTTLELRDPKVEAESFDIRNNASSRSIDNTTLMGELKDGSYLAFKGIDLKDIDALKIRMGTTASGLTLNINLDNAGGKTIATQALPVITSPSELREVTIPLQSVPSKHDLFFVISGGNGDEEIQGGIDWIYFNNSSSGKKLAVK